MRRAPPTGVRRSEDSLGPSPRLFLFVVSLAVAAGTTVVLVGDFDPLRAASAWRGAMTRTPVGCEPRAPIASIDGSTGSSTDGEAERSSDADESAPASRRTITTGV